MQAAEQAGNQAAGQAAAGAAGAGTTPAATPSLPSELQTLGETASWQTIAIAVAVIVLIVAVVLLALWWRKRRAQEPAPAVPRPDLNLQLARIWKPFYDRIPRRAHHYPTVVVLGDAGAGKSRLIDNRVDWRGQASELQPSQTGHSAMQLYLGPGVVVHEISAPLLRDISRDAGRALGHLWRRLGRQSVTAVLVVDVRSLSDTTPAALHELAHLVRGKLGILSGRGKRSVSLRLCLTHMDKVAGYVDLTRLLRRHGAGLDALRPDGGGQRGSQGSGQVNSQTGDGGFGRIEGWLSAAVVECDPEAFARVVSLYRQAPAIERALAPLVRTLEGEDGGGGGDAFAARYPLQGSYLSGLAASDHVGDPMAVDRSTVAASMARERRRHLVACGAAATVWAVLLTALFGWHSARLRDAERAVAVFDNTVATAGSVPGSTPSLRAELDRARREADTSLDRLAGSEVLGLGRTFQPRKQRVDERYLDSLRRGYVLPAATSRDRVRLLYAVSLLYAARDTDMGILIQGQPGTWAGALTMPERVITEYVRRSSSPWPELVTLPDDLQGTATTAAPEDWQALLTAVERMLARATITPAQLADLQAQVPALHQGDQYTTLARAAELLGQDPLLRTHLAPVIDPWPASAWVDRNSDALAGVSAMVRRAHLEVSDMAGASLTDLADELARLGQESQLAAQTYSFALDDAPAGNTILIDTAAWAALVQRSRARLLVDAFLTDVQDSERSPFFRDRARYADTGVLAGTRQGPTEVIRGIYTQAVYAAQVAPALRALGEERIAALPLAAGDRDDLYAYVQSSIDAYAAAYAGELAAYYDSFTFGVSSVDALSFELQALGQPTSWFVAFLRHVARNAALAEEENELFQVLNDYLTPFQPLVALAAEADGKMPQLEPYFTEIITPLLQALEGQAAAAGASSASGSASSSGAADPGGLDLSTAGALALAALQGQGEDYAAKTRAWLGTVNIVGSQQRPFLRPVQAAYALGQTNIEEAMAAAWQDQLLPQIAPVLAQFPFRRAATDEASADALEALLLPGKGSFWQTFGQTVATACVMQNGTWRALSPLRAPANMLATVNDLARLSRTLWDADGKRTPLALRLTPLPLPARAVTGRYAVLAYLTAGRASLYAFNQKPESQDLSLQWWAQDAASVGVQLDTPEAGGAQRNTKYRSIEVSDSAWAFYRLLERATMRKQRIALWQVPVSDSAHGKVRFRLDTDPWAPFQVRGGR